MVNVGRRQRARRVPEPGDGWLTDVVLRQALAQREALGCPAAVRRERPTRRDLLGGADRVLAGRDGARHLAERGRVVGPLHLYGGPQRPYGGLRRVGPQGRLRGAEEGHAAAADPRHDARLPGASDEAMVRHVRVRHARQRGLRAPDAGGVRRRQRAVGRSGPHAGHGPAKRAAAVVGGRQVDGAVDRARAGLAPPRGMARASGGGVRVDQRRNGLVRLEQRNEGLRHRGPRVPGPAPCHGLGALLLPRPPHLGALRVACPSAHGQARHRFGRAILSETLTRGKQRRGERDEI